MQHLLIIFLTFFPLIGLFSQTVDIIIPKSAAPFIDGIIDNNEWQYSHTAVISTSSGEDVFVQSMHDGENLYFAFHGALMSNGYRFPEINLDIDNNKSQTWQNDDWWFHVSATDCENNGAPGVYDNCAVTKDSWKAEKNASQNGNIADTVEIMIPFDLVGIPENMEFTFGLCLNVSNTFNIWEYYPSTSNHANPATWANATLIYDEVSANEYQNSELQIVEYGDEIIITSNGTATNASITDVLGREVDVKYSNYGTIIRIETQNLAEGAYYMIINNGNSRKLHNFVKNR